MVQEVFNPNPVIFKPTKSADRRHLTSLWLDHEDEVPNDADDIVEPIDQDEIYELVRWIHDPEYPNTLEELKVVSAPQISVSRNHVVVEFTPTVPHCGMSTIIGLSIRVRLLRSLPHRFKVDIIVKPGSHQSEEAVNKQLNDKERVAAALENPALVKTIDTCLEGQSTLG
ncbi:FAM96B protein [Armillaria nabsnona]|nr:FAM96B protein [Armillaria nabsnona]